MTGDNRKRYQVEDFAPMGRKGQLIIAAAVETPCESHGEHFGKLLGVLRKRRKQHILDAVRVASVRILDLVHPPLAVAGESVKMESGGRKLGFTMTNSNYSRPRENLSNEKDGEQMAKQLANRGYVVKEQERDLRGQEMIDKSNGFVNAAQEGDDLVIFYSGHGEVEGLVGVDNQLLTQPVVGSWMSTVLTRGSRLIVIIEACHSGSTADYIRSIESNSIGNVAGKLGKKKASDLAQVAKDLQQSKDHLSKIERAKQALMEEPIVSQLTKTNKLDSEIDNKEKEIQAAWNTELSRIENYANQVAQLTGNKLQLPRFTPKDKGIWLHSQQLFDLDKMTNQTLEFARQALR